MDFKIGTWNLDRSGFRSKHRWSAQLRQIDLVACDVWILSEANRRQVLSGMYGQFSAPGQYPYEAEEAAVAVWTRYPSQPVSVANPQLSAAVTLRVSQTKLKLLIYATIIPYKLDGCTQGQQPWARHRDAVDVLISDCKRLRAAHPDHCFVLAGDFNMSLSGAPWYGLSDVKKLLIAGLRELEVDCCTLDDPRAQCIPRGNVDHIFATHDLVVHRPMEAWYDDALSDHNGVAIKATLISKHFMGRLEDCELEKRPSVIDASTGKAILLARRFRGASPLAC